MRQIKIGRAVYTNKNRRVHRYWTKERCLTDAQKYKTRAEWACANQNAYGASKRNGWFNDCVVHMKPVQLWTLNSCIAEAKKYKTALHWRKNSNSSYQASRKLGCQEQCMAHMKIDKMRWTLEMCLAHAKKFKTKAEWYGSASWQSARRHKWLDECYKQFAK